MKLRAIILLTSTNIFTGDILNSRDRAVPTFFYWQCVAAIVLPTIFIAAIFFSCIVVS